MWAKAHISDNENLWSLPNDLVMSDYYVKYIVRISFK